MLDTELCALFVFLGQLRLELQDVRLIQRGLVIQQILAGLEVAPELYLCYFELFVQLLVLTAQLRHLLLILLDSRL